MAMAFYCRPSYLTLAIRDHRKYFQVYFLKHQKQVDTKSQKCPQKTKGATVLFVFALFGIGLVREQPVLFLPKYHCFGIGLSKPTG
jgi:hypothetical protein